MTVKLWRRSRAVGPVLLAALLAVGGLVASPASAAGTADVQIMMSDGVTTAAPGGSVTYTITVTNAGPNTANGATVMDLFPLGATTAWSCTASPGASCTPSGSGDIIDSVTLPVAGSVTYTATVTISPLAVGVLTNTATVAPSVGELDPNFANNSSTDTNTLVASADLSITKTDGVATATPGGSVTYTITASNAGPSNASGATVVDVFPAGVTASWTCAGTGGGTCTASGNGSINDSVNLPAGATVKYTAIATIASSAFGALSNTAAVSGPVGVIDPNLGNNTATDTDTLAASADLSITKTDGVSAASAGGSVTYTITASNAGPSNANGATVADTFPAGLTATWTCAGAGGGTCTAAGSGNINDSVNLPVGASVTYTATAAVSPSASGTLSNTATVSGPAGVPDPNPGNNSATDADTVKTAPAAPSVTGSTPSIGAVSVEFTPGADGGSPVTGFTAQCVGTDGGATGTATGASSPVSVTGLGAGKSYHCQVKATNDVGSSPYSEFGDTVVVPVPVTVPAAPKVTSSKPKAKTVTVKFTPGADGGSAITSYKVTCTSKNGGATRSKKGFSSPLKVKRLTAGKTYRCKVAATNAVGTGPSSAPGKKFKVPKRRHNHHRHTIGVLVSQR